MHRFKTETPLSENLTKCSRNTILRLKNECFENLMGSDTFDLDVLAIIYKTICQTAFEFRVCKEHA